MNALALKAKIDEAKRRLLKAEGEMERALHELGSAPREDKSIISSALSTAFNELRAARQDLTTLERGIAQED